MSYPQFDIDTATATVYTLFIRETHKTLLIKKMIKHSKQNWSVGEEVKVGFMKLKVISARAEKDGMPDIYTLESPTLKRYEFIPHNGLFAI